jgi:uncharacterized protein
MPADNIVPSLLIRFLLPCTVAISIGTEPQVALAKEPIAKTLLWEVSGNGLKQPSYLLGTIHVGCENRLTLTPEQQKALKKSQQLYLEIDFTKPTNETDIKIPGGKKLKDIMTPAQYEAVEDYFGNLDKRKLSQVRPSILAGFIANDVGERALKRLCQTVTSKESVLQAVAKQQNIPIVNLETIVDRDRAAQTMPIQEEVKKLLSMINSISFGNNQDSPEKYLANAAQNYSSQNLVAFCEKPSSTKVSTDERNRIWIPRIISAMSQKPTFFGFGTAHLCGDQGVISLLSAKGYTIRPIFDIKRKTSASEAAITAEDYFRSGKLNGANNQILDALDDYDQAITLNPQYSEAYYERGVLKNTNLKDSSGAIADLDRATAINPKDGFSYYQKGLIKSHKLNDYRSATEDFSQTIVLQPYFSFPYYERGLLRGKNLNDFQGALADFNIAITILYDYPKFYIARGILKYNKLNDKLGGIADIRRAIKIARFKDLDNDSSLNEALIALQIMGATEKPIP